MFYTRGQIEKSVLNELALVGGTSVQTYTEPVIIENIHRGFDHLYKKYFWPHLTLTTFHSLDGVAGVITDELVGLEDIDDIEWVREDPFEEKNDIPYFENGIFNTGRYGYTSLTWEHPQYSTKRIVFNPLTLNVPIAIRARRHPGFFEQEENIVPMDHLLMVHYVTASVLSGDGMNPGEAARQQGLMEDRFQSLAESRSAKPIKTKYSRWDSEFTVAP